MVIKHEMNAMMKSMGISELIEMYGELRRVFTQCLAIEQTIVNVRDDEKDEIDLLDCLEDANLDTELLELYTLYNCSKNPAVSRCLIRYIGKIYTTDDGKEYSRLDKLRALKKKIIDRYTGVSVEEMKELEELCAELIGFCIYVFKFEFDLAISHAQLIDNAPEIDVNTIVDKYNEARGIVLKDEIEFIYNTAEIFKPQIAIFDEYPELEDAYMNTMGAYAADVDEELLTIEIVQAVLTGAVLPEKVCEVYHCGNYTE